MSTTDDLCHFLNRSPTPSLFVSEARRLLLSRGVSELREAEDWLTIPTSFFVVRDGRSLIAVHRTDASLGVITAATLDSPCFLLKPDSQPTAAGIDGAGVSFYGSTTWHQWLDRDLRVAGSVVVRGSDSAELRLINSPHSVAIIPSIAIHLERTSGLKPVFAPPHFVPAVRLASGSSRALVLGQVAAELGVAADAIVDYELSFYDANPVQKVGITKSMVAGSRLANMAPAYLALDAFLRAGPPPKGLVAFAVFDGGLTGHIGRNGAASNFLNRVLARAGCSPSFYRRSLCIAADCWDTRTGPKLDTGVCHAATMELLGILQKLLDDTVKYQQSLAAGGSLDNVIARTLGIPAIRVGLPIGSRLSVREVASIADIESCAEAFYQIYTKFCTVD
jgi:aspartyl aminopeptidase